MNRALFILLERLAGYGLAGLFVLFGALQYNDPDPVPWILVYGSAAGIVLLLVHRPGWWILSMVVAILSARWAQTLTESLDPFPPLSALTGAMDPGRPEIEVGREALGLLIVTISLLVVGLRAWRRSALDIGQETRDDEDAMNPPDPGTGETHDRRDDRTEDA